MNNDLPRSHASTLICGWVDFDQLGSKSFGSNRTVAGGELSLPGVGLAVAHGVTTSIDRDLLVVAAGNPRFPDAGGAPVAPAQGAATAWAELYRKWGTDAPARVRGAYQVVIVDAARARVVLAVDRFAVRSLCYAREGSRLSFSDRADRVPVARTLEVDLQAIFDYLYFHVIPAPRTIFRRVSRVPSAHVVVVDARGSTSSRHWVPTFEERRRGSLEALKAEFRGLVRDAVAREAAAGNVGSFLSGGTDSSTVAGYLGEVTGKPAQTYSIGFDAQGYDEMEYARIAARRFGTDHHEYYVTPDDLVRHIPEVAAHYDQPFGNSSVLPAFCCAALARSDGIVKLLAGDGGDELFGGNTRYAKQRVFALYDRTPRSLRTALIEPLLLGVPVATKIPLVRKAASYVRQAKVPMPDRLNTYNLLSRLGIRNVLTPSFLASVDTHEPAVHQLRTWESCAAGSLVNRMLAYDWVYTLAENDLPKVRGATSLAAIDVGFPLLADEVVDFSLRLHPALKLRGLKLRWFFKEALRGFLPDEIITKTKHGFGLPFGVWATRHSKLRDLAAASLADVSDCGIVQREFVSELMQTRLDEHPGYYGEMVWILMMLGQWLRGRNPAITL